jgi:hypothetical protein
MIHSLTGQVDTQPTIEYLKDYVFSMSPSVRRLENITRGDFMLDK